MSSPNDRRSLLKSGVLVLAGGLAGCNGADGNGGEATDGSTPATDVTDAATTASTTTERTAADCVIESAVGDAEPIPALADGSVESEAETTVEVRWNARTQLSMTDSSSDLLRYLASRGRTYLVYQLEATNVTDRMLTVSRSNLFDLRLELCEATWFEGTTLYTLDGRFENGIELEPGESAAGFVAFEVPRDLDRATLVRDVERDDPEVDETFRTVCDRSLSFDVGTAE